MVLNVDTNISTRSVNDMIKILDNNNIIEEFERSKHLMMWGSAHDYNIRAVEYDEILKAFKKLWNLK